MSLESTWFILAESRALRRGQILARQLLGRSLILFRGPDGQATALEDRCIHRHASLSRGRLVGDQLVCGYHGWTYDTRGHVVGIPSEGSTFLHSPARCAERYEVLEQEGYLYIRLKEGNTDPFSLPHVGERGWQRLRLIHRFQNSLVNCAENFIDVPHTAYVHRGVFRSEQREGLEAEVHRKDGQVHIHYEGERANLGLARWFLNPSGGPIGHRDSFYAPNVTQVEYIFGPRRHFFITSQGVPLNGPDEPPETLVYTDLVWDYGVWSRLARPLVYLQAKLIIAQDLVALADQGRQIRRWGTEFRHTEADTHHVMVESLMREIEDGRDPKALPEKRIRMRFWV